MPRFWTGRPWLSFIEAGTNSRWQRQLAEQGPVERKMAQPRHVLAVALGRDDERVVGQQHDLFGVGLVAVVRLYARGSGVAVEQRRTQKRNVTDTVQPDVDPRGIETDGTEVAADVRDDVVDAAARVIGQAGQAADSGVVELNRLIGNVELAEELQRLLLGQAGDEWSAPGMRG